MIYHEAPGWVPGFRRDRYFSLFETRGYVVMFKELIP